MKRRIGKKTLLIIMMVILSSFLFSKSLNDTQIINSNDEIYIKFKLLQKLEKKLVFTNNTPISVGEMKLYLSKYNYEELSDNGKTIYKDIENFLYEKDSILPNEDIQLILHPKTTLETYYKTNKDISWSFDYNYVDNFISMPSYFGFGNQFSFGADMFFGKNYIAAKKNDNWNNLPFIFPDLSDVHAQEFYFPFFAYGSFGNIYENWGYNLNIGKQGKTIGQTLTGSIIYNSTFETDAYIEFSLFSDFLKYTMDVVQVSSNRMDEIQTANTERYMYLHQIDFNIFKNLKFSFVEGSLTANPLSIRFLNPFIFMHQFGGWTNYITEENKNIYRETNFCADFSYLVEYIPFANLRLYGIYNQIEMQMPWERNNYWGKYYPNSIGLQFGSEYSFYLSNNSRIDLNSELIYNSPYMYIKQTPSASLYRVRTDMQTKDDVYSWIGSPYGPDCFGAFLGINYDTNNKWKFNLEYSFVEKGANDFSLFDETVEDDEGKKYYAYYPSVLFKLNKIFNNIKYTDDELYEMAEQLSLSGIIQYTNQIKLNTTYCINDRLSISNQIVLDYIINNNHIKNKNDFGAEIDLSVSYIIY